MDAMDEEAAPPAEEQPAPEQPVEAAEVEAVDAQPDVAPEPEAAVEVVAEPVVEEPVVTEESVAEAMAEAIAKARAAAAAAAASEPEAPVTADPAAEPAVAADAPATNGEARVGRPRLKRFGQPANVLAPAPKPRKRKSRWENEESGDTTLALSSRTLWPTDITLPGGITVRPLHPALRVAHALHSVSATTYLLSGRPRSTCSPDRVHLRAGSPSLRRFTTG